MRWLSVASITNENEQIMVLTGFCPWKGHLLELEEEMGIAGELKYVLYAEGDPAGKWRIQVCTYFYIQCVVEV